MRRRKKEILVGQLRTEVDKYSYGKPVSFKMIMVVDTSAKREWARCVFVMTEEGRLEPRTFSQMNARTKVVKT